MYLHKKSYEIRYTDVDFNDRLKLSSLLSLMEESACLSADELGFGYEVVQPKNIGFILVNWYIELFKPIILGDVLTIHTWPLEPKLVTVFRDFELYVGDEKVGVATSRWGTINLSTFGAISAKDAVAQDIVYNDFRSVQFNSWKIPKIPCEGEAEYVKYVSYSDYDHYNHVNNTKYGDFLLDVFSPGFLDGKRISSAQITYVKQCKYGEKLELYSSECEGGIYIVEGRVDGETRIQLKVAFAEDAQ